MRTLPQVYSQRNPQWASQRLGTVNGTTIGQYGCYISSFSMVAGYFGHTITPAAFDDACTNKFYVEGNEATDDMLQKVFPDCKYVTSYNFYEVPADLALLKKLLDDPTLMVIVEVDFDHNPSDGIQTHFMVAVDSDGGNGIKMADPWYGSIDDFSKNYGSNPTQTILKYVVYKGTPVNQGGDSMSNMYGGLDLSNPESMKPCVDLFNKWKAGGFVEKSDVNANYVPKQQLLDAQKQIQDLQNKLNSQPAVDPKAQAKLNQIAELVQSDPIVKIEAILRS